MADHFVYANGWFVHTDSPALILKAKAYSLNDSEKIGLECIVSYTGFWLSLTNIRQLEILLIHDEEKAPNSAMV